MLREYAVDPNAIFRDLGSLQRFLDDFHAARGRVISAIPRDWFYEQNRYLRNLVLGPVARNNVQEQLRKIQNVSMIGGYTIPRGLELWLDQALHIKTQTELNGIMSSHYCEVRQIYDYMNLLEHRPNDWSLEQTISVERTAQRLSEAIEPALRLATTVFYVDPYFSAADNRFIAPLRAFIEKMMIGRCRLLTIHTTNRGGATRVVHAANLEQFIKPLLPTGFTLKLFIWRQQQMHDRFILTKNVGFSFGHGLDEAEYAHSLRVNISRLGESNRAEHFRFFSTKDDTNDNVIIVTGE